MLNGFRESTSRYLGGNIFGFLRRPLKVGRTQFVQDKHGLAITVDEVPANSEESRLGKPSASMKSTSGWLSAISLLLNALLFLLLGLALLLVWHFNTRRNGFSLVTENHYSWTYGPTAILVFVVAIWRQLDYHFKAAAPWIALHHGDADGNDTLLLDLTSPMQPVSFWLALRRRHFGVLLTIVGFVLLKIITLASTGLLVEDLTDFPDRSVTLNRNTKFNGSFWNITQPFGSQDASIAYAAYGVLARGVLVQDQGTTADLAYERIDLPEELRNRSRLVETQMNAFIPSFNCQQATVSINPGPYGTNNEQTGDTIAIVSPQCQLMGGAQPVFVIDASFQLCPKTQYRGNMVRVNCSTTPEDGTNWQLLTLAKVAYDQVLNGSTTESALAADDSNVDILSWQVGIEQVTSLLCRPSYTMGKVNVSYDFSENPPIITAGTPIPTNASLPGFEDGDLASRFTSSLVAGANMFGDLTAQSDLEEDFPNTMFKIMAASISDQGRYEALMGGATMQSAAERTFQQFAIQFADKYLLEKDASEIDGIAISIANRLKVAALPFWVMTAGFACMTVLALGAFILRPRIGLPPEYQTICGIAMILNQSPAFNSLIGRLRGLREKEVARKLSSYAFSAIPDKESHGASRIVVEASLRGDIRPSSEQTSNDDPSEEGKAVWWHPFLARKPVVVLVLSLLLSMIGVLELLQHRSDTNQGILTLPGVDDTTKAVYTRLLPALVILIVATSVNAIDFNIMVLAPFSALRSGEVSAKRSLASSLVNQLPPVGILKAAKNRHYAAFCSSTAAIVGSVLTILVSGLYTPEAFPGVVTQLGLATSDMFNTQWNNSATDDGTAALIVSLIESLNTSYPSFTYDELALPSLAKPNIPGATAGLLLQTTYPALRASLNCTAQDASSFNVSVQYNSRIDTTSVTVDASMPLPPNCRRGGPSGNLSTIDVTYRAGFQTNSSYFGKVLDLHVGPYDAIQGDAFGESDPGAQPDNPPGCPSLAFVYGYADLDRPEQNAITVLMCYQEMQTVETVATFDLASMSISTTAPPFSQRPFPNENTVQLLQSGPGGETAFSYRIQQHMDQSLSVFNQTQFASANLAEAPVDNFFQAVLFGKKPLPISTLVGEENKAVMLKGINAFYRRYMAQAISSKMRVPVDPNDPAANQSYPGAVYNVSQVVRLVQHNRAKLALQISLGIMTVLTAVACYLTKQDRLVPHNPCTVFGVAALLANSRMCSPGTFDALKQEGESVKYRMGWWDENQGVGYPSVRDEASGVRKRYGIDVVRDIG
ncbi:hypothetical protein G647_09101 [Cladophialophora carrionii CBS 160.54]|uniref:Uncharacterized protein n=1 Tax=Cladophialophora carrionii CBS 160.54 TaxID=1279043 RepID=V9CXA4_9EURO|nr:uncharacterized protein G647_09101 [Cladophialophora carrionii CBS 160.54]ETI19269.1 hypothetical protein G647_09101 [Cladophialophora carrionii CBS 160.54]